jgi:hypothetical protein
MAQIRVGEPDTPIDISSHTPGVPSGNSVGAYEMQPGHHPDGTADARRSTGVKPKRRDPILPVMPDLPPA